MSEHCIIDDCTAPIAPHSHNGRCADHEQAGFLVLRPAHKPWGEMPHGCPHDKKEKAFRRKFKRARGAA